MAIENVQTLADGTLSYRQSTPLDGVVFVLRFDWNARDSNWYLSVHDADDEPISGCVGRKLVADYPVLQRSVAEGRPAGDLLVVSGSGEDPGLFELGDGSILTYVPIADVEASAAGEEIA
jgi:hypothetical protein